MRSFLEGWWRYWASPIIAAVLIFLLASSANSAPDPGTFHRSPAANMLYLYPNGNTLTPERGN